MKTFIYKYIALGLATLFLGINAHALTTTDLQYLEGSPIFVKVHNKDRLKGTYPRTFVTVKDHMPANRIDYDLVQKLQATSADYQFVGSGLPGQTLFKVNALNKEVDHFYLSDDNITNHKDNHYFRRNQQDLFNPRPIMHIMHIEVRMTEKPFRLDDGNQVSAFFVDVFITKKKENYWDMDRLKGTLYPDYNANKVKSLE